MQKKRVLIIGGLLTAVGLMSLANEYVGKENNTDLNVPARIVDNVFEIQKADDTWTEIPIKGVNMGIAKPGHFPGESAITKEEYLRWFKLIAEMNANTIRVYTLHPPAFYEALAEYNKKHADKLYVFHGVWMNEDLLIASQDPYEDAVFNDFQEESRHIVDAIHGKVTVAERAGHSHGKYKTDVSDYVIGWILGVEWDPHVVINTNDTHQGIGQFEGQYFKTEDASPFEYFLAEQMEYITDYEQTRYNEIRPTSFTNWVTTDLLTHPSDTSEQEDIVSVDPNHIYTQGEMVTVGEFASYHIYPYYPEHLIYDEKYQGFLDHRGEENQYAAYLKELKEAHRLPVLVAEFGIPSSRGRTHNGPASKHQGFVSEEEQGALVADMYEDIMEADYVGGIVFSWQDEWFKRTWNTMDYDNPDRRPFWSNAQTSEQQFGLLSFDRHKVKVDGDTAEWTAPALYEDRLFVDHDERYLYLRLEGVDKEAGMPLILFDTIQGQGNHTTEIVDNVAFANGIDFIAQIAGEDSRLLVDSYYDSYNQQYGIDLKLTPANPRYPKKDSGLFSPMHYVLNNEIYLKDSEKHIPFTAYETGKLREGNGNPEAENYDSLADYTLTDTGTLELRIPWLLLQFRDPSQKEIMGNIAEKTISVADFIDEIGIGILFVDANKQVTMSYPAREGATISTLKGYTWENWDLPQSEERPKASYRILKETFEKY